MLLHIKIAGVLMMILALMHIGFPKKFRWREDLQQISLINRQMMYVHAFFIAFTVFMIGLVSVTNAGELVHGSFGRKISITISVFWFVRLVIQFLGYSPALWKGKRFETVMHVLFSVLWTYFTVVFAWAYLYEMKID